MADPEDEAQRQLTMEMIAHEDVHMWFGNLVTLKFWDVIWLNEGLTTFFAAWILDQVSC
jgi:aminopeptidase N